MSFEDEPKEIATSKDDLSAYQGGLDYVTTALRHSKVKLTWDQDDPQRSRLTRIDLSRIPKDKVDQIDYANYLASGSSDEESEQDDTTGGASRAAKFRAMLGLSAQPQRSSKSDRGAVKGDMEVTFRPVFEGDGDSASESGDEKQIDGDETTLDRYKRKERERRERKKQQRQAAMAADASGSQGEDQPDDFFEGFGDEDAAFAAALEAHDAGRDGPAGSGSQTSKKKSKAAKRAEKAKQAEENATQRAELELLVDEDGDKGHFDMDKIMRAEKAEGAGGASRSARRKRGAKAAKKEAEAKQALDQDSFVVDTRDDRFKSLAEDPAFAIDPSNPRYVLWFFFC